jgi:hydroxyacylglutathione hydrolase
LKIIPIKAFTDNYIWAICGEDHCVVVDPGDAAPVIEFLNEHQLTLSAVLITHHHPDHTGGIKTLSDTFPDLSVFGPHNPKIRGITDSLQHQERCFINDLSLQFTVMAAPGHTLDHIMYYTEGLLFCGDTLFSAGCGRLFEGTPEQMTGTLNSITALPADTMIYCTHEYTLANIEFALAVEPQNPSLLEYKDWVTHQRNNDKPSLPTSLQTQLHINPFLRLHQSDVKGYAETLTKSTLTQSVEVFAALRSAKDRF